MSYNRESFDLVIVAFITMNLMFYLVVRLLGEIRCLSLLGVKRLEKVLKCLRSGCLNERKASSSKTEGNCRQRLLEMLIITSVSAHST